MFPVFSINNFIIFTTVIVSAIALGNKLLLNKYLFLPHVVHHQKQWYRWISSGFIHADYQHLAFNMFSLFFLGGSVASMFNAHFGDSGNFMYLLLYLGGMVAANVTTYQKHKYNPGYACLGASGAVSAVVFSFIILNPWATLYVFFFPIKAILFGLIYLAGTYYFSKQNADFINHDAHLWGSIFGVVFTFVSQVQTISGFISMII